MNDVPRYSGKGNSSTPSGIPVAGSAPPRARIAIIRCQIETRGSTGEAGHSKEAPIHRAIVALLFIPRLVGASMGANGDAEAAGATGGADTEIGDAIGAEIEQVGRHQGQPSVAGA
jgi:hypothetical protein